MENCSFPHMLKSYQRETAFMKLCEFLLKSQKRKKKKKKERKESDKQLTILYSHGTWRMFFSLKVSVCKALLFSAGCSRTLAQENHIICHHRAGHMGCTLGVCYLAINQTSLDQHSRTFACVLVHRVAKEWFEHADTVPLGLLLYFTSFIAVVAVCGQCEHNNRIRISTT